MQTGTTLTVEKGSEIKNGRFEAFGALNAVGVPDALVYFRDVFIAMANNDPFAFNEGRINIAYANIIGASSYLNGAGYGPVTLTDSIVSYTNYMPCLGFGYPIADAPIERNIFYLSGGISTATNNNVSVYIKNNAFAEQMTPAVENRDSSSGATVAENNSFLSTDRMALVLKNGYGSDSNSAAISAASFISTSHINAPSPDAPRLFAGTDGSGGICLTMWSGCSFPTNQSPYCFYSRFSAAACLGAGFSTAECLGSCFSAAARLGSGFLAAACLGSGFFATACSCFCVLKSFCATFAPS